MTSGTFGLEASSTVPPGLYDRGCAVDPPMNWWAILDSSLRDNSTFAVCRVPTNELVGYYRSSLRRSTPDPCESRLQLPSPHIPEIDKVSA